MCLLTFFYTRKNKFLVEWAIKEQLKHEILKGYFDITMQPQKNVIFFTTLHILLFFDSK